MPVVIAAHGKHIPVVTHESDYTPGLANKINAKFADKILSLIHILPLQSRCLPCSTQSRTFCPARYFTLKFMPLECLRSADVYKRQAAFVFLQACYAADVAVYLLLSTAALEKDFALPVPR